VRPRSHILIAVASVAALVAALAPATTVTAATATRIVHFTPVTASDHLAPGFKVTQRFAHGMCEPGSDVLPGAYRCFAGNFVIDPCWPDKATASPGVYCPTAPWSHDVAHISLSQRLTASPGGPQGVWGLQLAGGQRCIAAQGAHDSFDNGRYTVNFFCPGSLVLLNQADRSGATWTILEATGSGNGYTLGSAASIAIAWLGVPSHL